MVIASFSSEATALLMTMSYFAIFSPLRDRSKFSLFILRQFWYCFVPLIAAQKLNCYIATFCPSIPLLCFRLLLSYFCSKDTAAAIVNIATMRF